MEDNAELLSQLTDIFAKTNLDNVTAESAGREELPDGYYNCAVEELKLTTSKASGKIMIAGRLKVNADGVCENDDASSQDAWKSVEGSRNSTVYKYWLLDNEKNVSKFVSDMIKFEDEDGTPILTKEQLKDPSNLMENIAILEGMYIWIMVQSYQKKDGTMGKNQNLVAWSRVKELNIPVEVEDYPF